MDHVVKSEVQWLAQVLHAVRLLFFCSHVLRNTIELIWTECLILACPRDSWVASGRIYQNDIVKLSKARARVLLMCLKDLFIHSSWSMIILTFTVRFKWQLYTSRASIIQHFWTNKSPFRSHSWSLPLSSCQVSGLPVYQAMWLCQQKIGFMISLVGFKKYRKATSW